LSVFEGKHNMIAGGMYMTEAISHIKKYSKLASYNIGDHTNFGGTAQMGKQISAAATGPKMYVMNDSDCPATTHGNCCFDLASSQNRLINVNGITSVMSLMVLFVKDNPSHQQNLGRHA
jgi:hypothetical protein